MNLLPDFPYHSYERYDINNWRQVKSHTNLNKG